MPRGGGSAIPRTRSKTERDVKVAAILDAAESQLVRGGYEGLSVAGIARELAVAQNTIYWYFGSKDELLIATLRRMIQHLIAAKPRNTKMSVIDRVVWFTNRLEFFYRIKGAVGQRAIASPVVAEFIHQTNEVLRRMLTNVLSGHVPQEELDTVAEAFAATVEGAFSRGLTTQQRQHLFAFTLARLLPPPDPSGP